MFDTATLLDTPFLGIPYDGAAEHLAALSLYRHDENVAAARKVHAAYDLYEIRLGEASTSPDGSPLICLHTATAEVATVLRCSAYSAGILIDVGAELTLRLPITDRAFRGGDLDYSTVRTICALLRDASAATIAEIEADVVAAAMHLTPVPLRSEIWRLWLRADPTEAAAVRADKRRTDRTAYVRRGDNGMSWLSACITDIEGADAVLLLDELAATVCDSDPRSKSVLRADALVGLLHGERILLCQCGDTMCPAANADIAPRRGHLAQILIDIDTLLGLTSTPATLADGTVLDAELARKLAEDANWQGLLTEMRTLAENLGMTGTGDNRADAEDSVTPAPDDPAPTPMPAPVAVRRFCARGRIRRSGPLGPAVHSSVGVRRVAGTGIGSILDQIINAVAEHPVGAVGAHPDGHGGHTTPPAGALTYRPTAEVAAFVRATHPTCTFPGCTVASRKCELDHQVPFDHDDPEHGGWTVASNLHPLCKKHHDLKTRHRWSCIHLGGGAVLWRSRSGLVRITLPATMLIAGLPAPPPTPPKPPPGLPAITDRPTAVETVDLLYEATWWEIHMDNAPPPPLTDIAMRARYQEHQAITRRRYALAPPPF